MTLQHHFPKTATPPQDRRQHTRAREERAHVDSSDDSGNETPIVQRPRRSRKARTGHGKKSARRPPVDQASSSTVETSSVAFNLMEMVTPLVNLDEFLLDVPVENRILQALSFDAIDSREDSIEDANSGTFGWLLAEPAEPNLESHMVAARKSLLCWLSGKQGVYHISGKPGSGKSTLFKLIANHARTESELKTWTGDKELIIISYYFWNSGSAAQASFAGMQRSILLQLVRKCPEATRDLFPDVWYKTSKLLENGGKAADSSLVGERDLWAAWELFSAKQSSSYRVCIFIDGLDEYNQTASCSYSKLAGGLNLISRCNPAIKFCVSSRPMREFMTAFDSSQRIHLHEVTSRDVRAATASTLLAMTNQQELTKDGQALVELIADKSDGVFVWVKTVLSNVQAMVASSLPLSDSAILRIVGDDVSAYPSDIDDLYDHLLKQVDNDHRTKSGIYFSLVIDNRFAQPPNAMWFYWVDRLVENPDFPGKPGSAAYQQPYTAEQVRVAHDFVRQNLSKLGKGLLRMHTDRRERKDGDQFYRQRVQFTHRTGRDFFRHPRGRSHLESSYSFASEEPVHRSSDSALSTSGTPSRQAPVVGTSGKAPRSNSREHAATETLTRLRLADMVLAGKYKAAPGADPRRRRLYSNYLESLFLSRTAAGVCYQIPFQLMEILRKDLEKTEATSFGSSYAVGSFKSVTGLVTTEDPEKSASFRHFALVHGQYEYVVKDSQRANESVDDPVVEGKSKKGKAKSRHKKSKTKNEGDLSLLLTAVFGQARTWKHHSKLESLLCSSTELSFVKIGRPVGNDFLSEVPLRASVPMIYMSLLLFTIQCTFEGFQTIQARDAHLLELLTRVMIAGLERPDADTTTLEFVFLLEPHRPPVLPIMAPRPSSTEKDILHRSKAVPKDLHEWITSPMKDTSGEPIFPDSAGPRRSGSHPCGVDITETRHMTLKTLLSRYVEDKALLARFCELMPGGLVGKVLDERSEVFANSVLGQDLFEYRCTRVVASDGLVVDANSDLCFRVY